MAREARPVPQTVLNGAAAGWLQQCGEQTR
jgi:hypothetical protein